MAASQIAEAARTLASPLLFDTDAAWGLAVEASFTDVVGGDQAVVHWPDSGRSFSQGITPTEYRLYREFFPLMQSIGYVERAARLGVATRREAYGPHYEAMQQTVYVNEYLPSVRGYDALAVTVPSAPVQRGAPDAGPAQVLVHLSTPGRTFGPDQVAVGRQLFPAFAAGVAVHGQLGAARADLEALVDATGGACAVVGMDGRLLHRSRALEEALAREPARADVSDAVLDVARRALRGAGAAAGHAVGARGTYRLSASGARGLRPVLVVTVDAPPEAQAPPDVDAERHGLTPRQADVAVLLAERRSNKEIAAALSVSVHTARHHVEAVLARLGVRRSDVGRVLRDG